MSNIRISNDRRGNTILLRRDEKTQKIIEILTIGRTPELKELAETLNDLADAQIAIEEFNVSKSVSLEELKADLSTKQ